MVTLSPWLMVIGVCPVIRGATEFEMAVQKSSAEHPPSSLQSNSDSKPGQPPLPHSMHPLLEFLKLSSTVTVPEPDQTNLARLFWKFFEIFNVPLTSISKTQGFEEEHPDFWSNWKLPSTFTVTPDGITILAFPCALTETFPLILTETSNVNESPFPMFVSLPNFKLDEVPPHIMLKYRVEVPGKSTSQFWPDAETLHNKRKAKTIILFNWHNRSALKKRGILTVVRHIPTTI